MIEERNIIPTCFKDAVIIVMKLQCIMTLENFYPRDAMLARSLRQRRVRLSVRHTLVLCLGERKQDREMNASDSPMILVSGKV